MIKRINNKGFVFIETIITAVILLTALLLLYKSYSDIISKEKRRLYYDDVVYIYKTIAIRDIFKKTYNKSQFDSAVSKNKKCNASGVGADMCKYIYFFNIGSPIYYDNTNMVTAKDFFEFYQLAYIDINDIKNLKACKEGSSTLCTNTLKYINGYSYTNFFDYIKSLDVDTDSGHTGILISIFFLTKNGEKINSSMTDVAFGKYEECIQEKAFNFYKTNYNSSISKADALKQYNKNKNLNFSIQCSYAYYYSWVYL